MATGDNNGKAGRVFSANFTEEEKRSLMETLARVDKAGSNGPAKTVLYKSTSPSLPQPSRDEIREAVNRAVARSEGNLPDAAQKMATKEPDNIPIPKNKPFADREKSEIDRFCESPEPIDEICETCCDAHLQIIFQREKKVIAKGKTTENWYATVGTMTVRKLTKKERLWLTPVNQCMPTHEATELLTSDYVEPGYKEPDAKDFNEKYAEKGVPGTGRSNRKGTGEKNMVRAATHGLAAWEGGKHSTYNYKKIVDGGNYKYRALNIMATKDVQSTKLMGQRSGVNIHVSGNWKWTDACFLPVPKGGIHYEPLDKETVENHKKTLGLKGNKAEYTGSLPYWSGQATLKLLDQLIKIVEDFAKETGQLDGKGRLPLYELLKCVEVIIREPAKGYETIYMNWEKSGLYKGE